MYKRASFFSPLLGILTVICLIAVLYAPAIADTAIPGSFRDVPGITPEEIAAIELLQKERPYIVYGMALSTDTFIWDDGTIGGYSALFCEWISNFFGIEFVPHVYEWNELLNGLESQEISFTGELTPTPERRKKYLMTTPFTLRTAKAFRLRKSEPLSEIAKSRKVRYVFLQGAANIDAVMNSSEFPIDASVAPTQDEAMRKVLMGQVDAYIGEEHALAAFNEGIVGEEIFPVVFSPISLTTANRELEAIVSVFDKYLKTDAFTHLLELSNQGREDFLRYRLYSWLTNEEKAYIAAHQSNDTPVLVAAELDAYPSSFYNKQEEQWQGIAMDVLHRISDLTGLKFQMENADQASGPVLFDKLESGELSMITELIYSEDRKDRFLWTEEPYSLGYYALLSRVDFEDVSVNQILHSKIGLITNSGYAHAFMTWFPEHNNLMHYDFVNEAFDALESGEIDLLMASRALLLLATNYYENPGVRANLIFNRTYGASFGFNKHEKILCSIISKAQMAVDTRAIADSWNRKTFDYRAKMAQAQIPYLFAMLILLACILALISFMFIRNRQMNARLEQTVQERTAELEIQTEAARVASQAKGDFLSRMSHEIRTPLNAVIGMAQIAKKTAAVESPKTVRSIDELIAASSHLLGILNDVLDMSKIEAGKFTLSSDPFSMRLALHDVENIIAQRCTEKGINFITNIMELPDFYVMGDSLRLKQVLINLLGNAGKFTDTGGEIKLLAQPISEDTSTVVLRFSVVDSGIGMSSEQVSKLFTAFEQTDAGIANKFGGTGLGLAISQHLINQMGGNIAVNSVPGQGSTFSFAINFQKTDARPEEPENAPVATDLNLSDKRILLVEDMLINRQIIIELLADTGLNIEEAEDGLLAVEKFESSPANYYDLVFMDIQMPRMNGYEAASSIRNLDRPDAKTVPIIAMTANAYREDIEHALASGMNGHLAKPVNIAEVIALLAEKLG